MFTSTWKVISPGIPENSPEYREWANLAIIYYQYFNEQKKIFIPGNLITLRYDDLVADPFAAVVKIYDRFNLNLTKEFENNLRSESEKSRTYKSKHQYSLVQYGLNKEFIYREIPFVFEEYGFEK
jgi:hypothetical protein